MRARGVEMRRIVYPIAMWRRALLVPRTSFCVCRAIAMSRAASSSHLSFLRAHELLRCDAARRLWCGATRGGESCEGGGGLVGVSTRKPTSTSDFESVPRIFAGEKLGRGTHRKSTFYFRLLCFYCIFGTSSTRTIILVCKTLHEIEFWLRKKWKFC